MKQYNKEEELKLQYRVYITKEVNNILKKEKVKQGISKAKITCNLIIKEYGQQPIQNIE